MIGLNIEQGDCPLRIVDISFGHAVSDEFPDQPAGVPKLLGDEFSESLSHARFSFTCKCTVKSVALQRRGLRTPSPKCNEGDCNRPEEHPDKERRGRCSALTFPIMPISVFARSILYCIGDGKYNVLNLIDYIIVPKTNDLVSKLFQGSCSGLIILFLIQMLASI